MNEPGFAEEEPRIAVWGNVWVSPETAMRIQQDAMLHGSCFMRITRKEDGRVIGERIDPLAIRPLERGA